MFASNLQAIKKDNHLRGGYLAIKTLKLYHTTNKIIFRLNQ